MSTATEKSIPTYGEVLTTITTDKKSEVVNMVLKADTKYSTNDYTFNFSNVNVTKYTKVFFVMQFNRILSKPTLIPGDGKYFVSPVYKLAIGLYPIFTITYNISPLLNASVLFNIVNLQPYINSQFSCRITMVRQETDSFFENGGDVNIIAVIRY